MGLQIGFEATKEDFGPYNRRTIINDSVSSSKAINLSEVNHKFDVLEDKINNFENRLSILNSKINQGIADIVALITTKDAADLDVIRTTFEALIATIVQTSNTALEYVDVNDASKKYKIVIVDGQLAVEDITPAG